MSESSRILVVEDDEITRSLMVDLLEHNGYEVVQAENGLQALDFLNQDVPDLIISDVMMPKMSGLEFFRKVQGPQATRDIDDARCRKQRKKGADNRVAAKRDAEREHHPLARDGKNPPMANHMPWHRPRQKQPQKHLFMILSIG